MAITRQSRFEKPAGQAITRVFNHVLPQSNHTQSREAQNRWSSNHAAITRNHAPPITFPTVPLRDRERMDPSRFTKRDPTHAGLQRGHQVPAEMLPR
jgi:hypothetical protein